MVREAGPGSGCLHWAGLGTALPGGSPVEYDCVIETKERRVPNPSPEECVIGARARVNIHRTRRAAGGAERGGGTSFRRCTAAGLPYILWYPL